MKRVRFFWWLIAGPVAVLAAMLAVAHPYLEVSAKSGGNVLVVEGWMDRPQLEQAARIAITGHYERIYTTGTVRPFAYWLKRNEGVEVRLREARHGRVAVNASGIGGASFALISDGDTLLEHGVVGEPTLYSVELRHTVDRLRIVSLDTANIDAKADNIFVKDLTVNGEDAHLLQLTTALIRADGRMEYATPTYAHYAENVLVEYGVPSERIIATPSWGVPDSRSWANASAFAWSAPPEDKIAFDVVTLGVHARRTRALFRQACGPLSNVGVIPVPDPDCAPGRWWKRPIGWQRMLKEIYGSPEAQAVELTH